MHYLSASISFLGGLFVFQTLVLAGQELLGGLALAASFIVALALLGRGTT